MPASFFYDTGDSKEGPVSGAELLRLYRSGNVPPGTWVRRAGSSTWRRIEDADLREDETDAPSYSAPWDLLKNRAFWRLLLPVILFAVLLVVLVIGLLRYSWPVLLVLLIAYLLTRATRE